MANDSVNAAAANSIGNGMEDALAAFVGYCDVYSYAVLIAAIAFLAVGLVSVAFAAYHEGRKGLAEAKRVEEEARKAAAEAAKAEADAQRAREAAMAAGVDVQGAAGAAAIPVNAVVTFVKSFAAVLGDAKAWVAMILIGLLLLWMAGNAPTLCARGFNLTGGGNEQEERHSGTSGNSAGNTSRNASAPGNSAAEPANGTAGPR